MTDLAAPPLRVGVVIPARNEALAIGSVIAAIPEWVDEILVVDNGSTDGTGHIAQKAGASVVTEPIPGYGRACLAGIAAASACDVIVFLDGDGADDPAQMAQLVQPILTDKADFVIGSRLAGNAEKGSLNFQQRFGNRLACALMRRIWGAQYTDLGPFRAIRRQALEQLSLRSKTYGWTAEMQCRAAKFGLRSTEVPVVYRRRVGTSKISGTVKGTVLAGYFILTTIAREALTR